MELAEVKVCAIELEVKNNYGQEIIFNTDSRGHS